VRYILGGQLGLTLDRPVPPALDLSPDPHRRRLLLAGAAAPVLLEAACHPAPMRQASPTAAPATAAQIQAFMAASRRLTGKTRLDAELGRRLHAALRAAYPSLDRQIDQLGVTPGPTEAHDALATPGPQTVRGLEQRVVRAWYLGLVGDGWDARAYAYEAALMYPPVADKVVMQSYCRGAPGYWAKPA
jgi:hypothetical protein